MLEEQNATTLATAESYSLIDKKIALLSNQVIISKTNKTIAKDSIRNHVG